MTTTYGPLSVVVELVQSPEFPGISLRSLAILAVLAQVETVWILQKDLAEKLSLDKLATTRCLDELSRLGFVDREANPDTRRMFVRITEKGRAVLPK